jgi:hypothetical protein
MTLSSVSNAVGGVNPLMIASGTSTTTALVAQTVLH